MGNIFDDLNKSVRGTTLTNQEIDLFNIIEKNDNQEEIYKYLTDILEASKIKNDNNSNKLKQILGKDKKELYEFIMNNLNRVRNSYYKREDLEKLIKEKGMPEEYIDEILNLIKYFTHQTHGILTFLVDKNGETINPQSDTVEIDKEKTFQKVKALYNYTIGKNKNGEKRFNRLTLDSQGKFGTVAGAIPNDKEAVLSDYNLNKLRDGYEFARKHGMDVRINALVFFKDFPDRLVGQDAERYKTALINYGKAVATVVNEYKEKGVPTTIDMFNEFVDYFAPFSERTNNWMSKLNINDMCDIAVTLKKEMPEADFGYNDWNFENPEKRKTIFSVIEKIQEYEKKNNCKVIDHIGMQCHTNINDKDELINAIEEAHKRFNLPIDITELDISKEINGFDYTNATPEELKAVSKLEQKLQNEMMKTLREYAKRGIIRGITQWSITDELCCDFCDGKEASVTGMKYENGEFIFEGKDIDKEIEITQEEMDLIEENKLRFEQKSKESINKNPIQDFCYHTHTERCGHAQKDTGDSDYIKRAIKGGIKTLAFTDHAPLPEMKKEDVNSRMDMSELESYLKEIEYYKEKYKEIKIESGFEFEYDDRYLEHIQYLKSRTDKMVLGQHFVIDENDKRHEIKRGKHGVQISDTVLELYSNSIETAIKNDIPDIIAHPDLFMQARDKFGEAEKEATRKICESAIEKGIPLEINLGNIDKYEEEDKPIEVFKDKISYPSKAFWEFVANEYGDKIKVLFGKDAHFPKQLSNDRDYEIAREIIGQETLEKLTFVKSDLQTKDEEIITRLENLKQKKEYTKPEFEILTKEKNPIKYNAVITALNTAEEKDKDSKQK